MSRPESKARALWVHATAKGAMEIANGDPFRAMTLLSSAVAILLHAHVNEPGRAPALKRLYDGALDEMVVPPGPEDYEPEENAS